MSKGIFIIGTDTEVGKTVVCAGLMQLLLENGCKAAYFKPVASGVVVTGGVPEAADAAFVRAASGFTQRADLVTPFVFVDAVSPHFAARLADRPIDRVVIRQSMDGLKKKYDLIVAEGAGGLAVPINDTGFMQYELIRELNIPCLLTARAGLGTINHTLLTLRFADDVGLTVKGIIINRADGSQVELDNIETIGKLSGIKSIYTLPSIAGLDAEKLQPGNLREIFAKTINIDDIVSLMEII